MPYSQTEDINSRPANEKELSKHNKPTIVKVPSNASEVVDKLESAKATATNAVGDPFLSAGKAVTKGVKEFSSAVADASGKIQSAKATAQSAAQDPVSFVAGLAEQATGFSIPTSPEGLINLLSKFSEPKVSGDGRTDIAKAKSEGNDVISEIGDVASLTGDALTSKISSVSEALAPITEVAGAVTEIASLGGVPVDNVISNSINKVSSPVQTTLTKVKNVTDGTQGIIT